jgi:NAD(P)H-quinone oxidoreductase subunit 5
MLLLVTTLGLVIVSYSSRYLNGEQNQKRYVTALLVTLSCVCAVIASRHLAVIAVAWLGTSVSLHALLTFYGDRIPALIAAHKKFIASRIAEACLALALVLIYTETGTIAVDDINRFVQERTYLEWQLHAAAVLMAVSVILKSAQLPFHGWLMQVMEAPTPISALLHAGVVNLGGFVLIRLAALISAVPLAQALLVIVGTVSAILAGLVMMTRISVKVRLAWSTAAQMGFMLVECGLGLYELALLHIIAHSLYKAYSFLASGDTVEETRRQRLFRPAAALPVGIELALRLMAFPAALVIVGLSTSVWHVLFQQADVPYFASMIVALGLAPVLWPVERLHARPTVERMFAAAALTQLYLAWHFLYAAFVPHYSMAAMPGVGIFVTVSFTALYVAQAWILTHPTGSFATRLYPWTYGGFYLDERFTRLTFRLWPPRIGAQCVVWAGTVPVGAVTGEQA